MKKLLYLFLAFASFGLLAQSYDDASEASELCLFVQGDSFMNDSEAEVALDKVLSVIGASKRFILQPCSDIDNAVATSYKGLRYILYDKEFMSTIANNTNAWSQLFILAHEVGHHVNGHTLDLILYASEAVEPKTLEQRRRQELESDEFAGFILGRLGASLEQTSEAINFLSSDKDDTYSTHPKKRKRLAAIKNGYDRALGDKPSVYENNTKSQKAEEHFYKAYNKAVNKDHAGAISYYSKVIELDPKVAMAYNNRGISKAYLKNYYGAIADFTEVIELDPSYAFAYYGRGLAKYYLGDMNGACRDARKAQELGHNASKVIKAACK